MKGCDCLGAAVVLIPEGPILGVRYTCVGQRPTGNFVSSGLEQDVLIGVTYFRVRCLTTSTVFTCLNNTTCFFTGSINVHHNNTVTVVFDR